MKVASVLRKKGSDIHTVVPGSSMIDAVQLMVDKRIGSLIVVEHGRPVAIITERDVLRAIPRHGTTLAGIEVRLLMSSPLISCSSDDTVDHAMDLMTNNTTGWRIRHLAVIDRGKLVGVLSIGDVVEALLTEAKFENRLLKNFIRNWPEEE